jgi:superfamily II DNA or RNA helicase
MIEGVYEQLINQLISDEIDSLPHDQYYVEYVPLKRKDAALFLAQYFSKILQTTFGLLKEDKDSASNQIELANKLIQLLSSEIKNQGIEENLLLSEGKILKAVFSKINSPYADLEKHVASLLPSTGLRQSELFTGNKSGVSLESEIRKEIESADEIQWIVSFIRFSGLRIFLQGLQEFAKKGKKIKIITTTYMGATEPKAIEELAKLPNTEIKISYNTKLERVHAKAYLFLRNTNFNTGYIGSSNISRTALTSGLEWNLKITTQEIPHVIDKFQKTFDTYWNDSEFELFDINIHKDKLRNAIDEEKYSKSENNLSSFFDITPHNFQKEILQRLLSERAKGNFRNLVIAATGTGKTVISAFDFKQFYVQNPNAKFLFVAHREEILKQALHTYRHILKDQNFGSLWFSGHEPANHNHIFASVQTIANRLSQLNLKADFYDYIVIDEVHHIPAKSYRPILIYFKPKILLGLTATPERMDGEDILFDFGNSISAEIRLPEALNRKLLCPFQYFGISDSIDLSNVSWRKGRYDVNELENIYSEDDRRVIEIIHNCERYLSNLNEVCAIGFCVSKKHAQFMAKKFLEKGLKAADLTSDNSNDRVSLLNKLKTKEINYLFVVDMFNEGVDIPQIDTVLFLRPTDSLTIFLQQMGRGLRLHQGKDCLTILDFVGNSNPEYDFEHKFRAMIGKTHIAVKDEIETDFPHLPLGCSIVLERRAKEIIIANIKKATSSGLRNLIKKIQNFNNSYTLPLSLANLLKFESLDLLNVYKSKNTWDFLLSESGIKKDFIPTYFDVQIGRMLGTTWLSTDSISYFEKVRSFLKNENDFDFKNAENQIFLLMLFYDIFQYSPSKMGYNIASDGIKEVFKNITLKEEVLSYLEIRINQCECIEKNIHLSSQFPLKVNGRYTRSQILVALKLSTENKKSSNREGVAVNKTSKIEALFVTLDKSQGDYSPTTMYEDYAITENLFHWQSQNSTKPDSLKGLSYIKHLKEGKTILLFVREKNVDENGLTMAYVFLGPAKYLSHEGSQPMSIKWILEEAIPPGLFNESRKLAVG